MTSLKSLPLESLFPGPCNDCDDCPVFLVGRPAAAIASSAPAPVVLGGAAATLLLLCIDIVPRSCLRVPGCLLATASFVGVLVVSPPDVVSLLTLEKCGAWIGGSGPFEPSDAANPTPKPPTAFASSAVLVADDIGLVWHGQGQRRQVLRRPCSSHHYTPRRKTWACQHVHACVCIYSERVIAIRVKCW